MATRTRKYTDMGWREQDALWAYDCLTEPLLSSELSRLSGAHSSGDTDCVSFQPCPDPTEANQDRYIVQDWKLRDGTWKFRGIFDGHAGHDTVDYVRRTLPAIIEEPLAKYLTQNPGIEFDPEIISTILADAITHMDKMITDDLLRLFPSIDLISRLSDEEIDIIINDTASGGINSATVSRCMAGSTVLISLIDSTGSNLWVASLGDCQAVLGSKKFNGHWEALRLSSYHNGADKSEQEKIKKDHPGEPQCIVENRVLGAISVTRAIGDHLFKLPSIYTNRIFMMRKPGFSISRRIEDFLDQNLTPPYLSSHADVRHITTNSLNATEFRLVLCSDGLIDLYDEKDLALDDLAHSFVQILGEGDNQVQKPENLALLLLRDALGGKDSEKVSRMMTVEMYFRWMDDTTIVVQKF